jgi:hypothetical protein
MGNVARSLKTKVWQSREITTVSDWDNKDVVAYANGLANVIIDNSIAELDDEMTLFEQVLNNEDNQASLDELALIAEVYEAYVRDTANLSVPDLFLKEHLDLLNSYQAIQEDIRGLTQVDTDPMQSLVHIQRYFDSAEGMQAAYVNLIYALEPFAAEFSPEDSALLLAIFDPRFQPSL